MSDPLCMSLDDIIKQKKTKKVLGVRGRGSGGRNNKVKASPAGGRVSRNFKGKLINSPRNKKISPKRRGGGQLQFNTPKKNGSPRWQRSPGNAAGRARISPKRRQQNRAIGKPFVLQPQYQYQQPISRSPRRRRQGVPVNQRIPAFRSIQNNNWQGKLKFARKSVYRARQQLIKTKILQNVRNRGQAQYVGGTGRILVGKFGLVTTQQQNLMQRQTMMQRKILRARQIRERQLNAPLDNFVFHAPGRRQGRFNRNKTREEPWGRSPSLPNAISRNYTRRPGGRGGGFSDVDDAWVPPLITVRNSEHDTRVEREPRYRASSSGLDPNIQRKIQYIQEQGRQIRSNEHGQARSHSGRGNASYMSMEDEPTDFQPTILSSRMTLSDRFKRFMN